jgi:hypothetical protein
MWHKPIIAALILGSACGGVILGIGGRMAMRGYALLDYQEPYFTLPGSATVVAIAAVAGAATGLLMWAASRLFRTSMIARQLFFWAGLVLLTARVLNPLSVQRIEVFGPLALLHGLVLWFAWTRLVHRLTAADVVSLPGNR